MRLFFAVPVPKEVARSLSAVRDEFGKEAEMKWVPHQNLHLTLCPEGTHLGQFAGEKICSGEERALSERASLQ